MDETYGTNVDDECFDMHDYDDDTDHDAADETDDDTDGDDTDNSGRLNLYPIKAQGSRTLSGHEWPSWKSCERDIQSNSSPNRALQF